MSKTNLEVVTAPALKAGNDAGAAKQLHKLYNDAQNGLRRVVALGLFCFELKEQLPHGQFQKWLEGNCPKVSYRSLASYMQLTSTTLESCGLKIGDYLQKCSTLHFSHAGALLLLPEKKVPEAAKSMRDKICALIDGKSARQLMLEFKQVDDDLQPKRGNLHSKGRAPKDVSPEAALEAQRKVAREDVEAATAAITALGPKFVVLSDSKADTLLLTTLQATLETQLKAVSTWLNKPADKRDARKIEELFQ